MSKDTIYRQDAIDVVKHAWAKGLEPSQYIEELPSAQPDVPDMNVGDTIYRQAAIDAIQKLNIPEDMCVFEIKSHIEVEIAALPSAQPEYYGYSDIEPLWKSFAEENDINLNPQAKQLKDAMWCGYEKGKKDTQPEPQWIPCSENLPTKEGHYLCSFKEPSLIDRIHVKLAYWTGGRWYGYLANEINAWMPLPEPYKGRREE